MPEREGTKGRLAGAKHYCPTCGHHMLMPPVRYGDAEKRATLPGSIAFWSLVEVLGDDECWPWHGRKHRSGHGRWYYAGKEDGAHRLSVSFNGVEIPPGMFVDHICRNPSCVNPRHLRVVTPAVNNVENSISFAALNKAKTHCPRGHELSGSNLMTRPCGKRRCRECVRFQERGRAQQRRKNLATA